MKKHLQELQQLLTSTTDKIEITAIIEDLLTPQELESISERLQIIKLLTEGETQRSIAQKLNVSIGKVTRGSRVFQYGKTDWRKIL